MTDRSSNAIRQGFLDFFSKKAGHTVVPSSPVVPYDDPTLLFTNAGMNQFKDVFLAQGSREYCRAVDSQKCIRAGGKHNDLEDVGRDTYHHTFFEMLGNWSFGDYFKEEAIRWSWELLTEVWGMDKDRLYATVFAGDQKDGLAADDTARQLWCDVTDIDPTHISLWDRKDNFWEMGATGPCGPCSEIHYDSTPDGSGGPLVNLDHPDVIEIWNLVFIQYNRGDDGSLIELPARHIDTGMGLERVTRILQGKRSNYDTDLWTPIFERVRAVADTPAYGGVIDNPVDVAYRVLADHARCLTVAISDGARPGNEGREYVLRRILRRGVRIARQAMGVDGIILASLVDPVVETLGDAFPELKNHQDKVKEIIAAEEEAFLRTLDRGLMLFAHAASAATDEGATSIGADEAFTLHDTYGFPIDLTELMATEQGLTVDRPGYEALMDAARATSRQGGSTTTQATIPPEVLAALTADNVGATDDDAKFKTTQCTSLVKAIWDGDALVESAPANTPCSVILDQTCFYAQQGGQIGDQGTLTADSKSDSPAFDVTDTTRIGDFVLHHGTVGGADLGVGAAVKACVAPTRRRDILANHTATHLLNLALRTVLGDDVQQRGSLVADDRLRFDFSHPRGMSIDEVSQVQRLVRAAIDADLTVHTQDVELKQGLAINGVRAVFGEQYPDPVRVVSIGPPINDLLSDPDNDSLSNCSIEFCGGTHLASTDAAGTIAILSEGALAAGIRRLTAVTGDAAIAAIDHGEALLAEATSLAASDDQSLKAQVDAIESSLQSQTIPATDRVMIEEKLEDARHALRSLEKDSSRSRREHVVTAARSLASEHDGSDLLLATIDDADKESLLAGMDAIRAACPDTAIMLFGPDPHDKKVVIVASVAPPLIKRGLRAGDWIKEAAKACGGGGGGRPDSAQAGGKDPSLVPEAIDTARTVATAALENAP